MNAKKFWSIVLIVSILSLFLVTTVFAQGETPPPVILSAEQVILVGLIGSALTTVLTWVYEFFKKEGFVFPKLVGETVTMLVSCAVAYLWFPVVFPPWLPGFSGELPAILNGILAWLGTWVSFLGGFFLTAHYVYGLLLKPYLRKPISARLLAPKAKKK